MATALGGVVNERATSYSAAGVRSSGRIRGHRQPARVTQATIAIPAAPKLDFAAIPGMPESTKRDAAHPSGLWRAGQLVLVCHWGPDASAGLDKVWPAGMEASR